MPAQVLATDIEVDGEEITVRLRHRQLREQLVHTPEHARCHLATNLSRAVRKREREPRWGEEALSYTPPRVSLKQSVNRALRRTIGYELQKPRPPHRRRARVRPGDRLLEAPVVILCSVRSGSTLLRVLLDSHSKVHSPHEMHLRDMTVQIKEGYSQKALREVGLNETRLRHLLWDRVLHRELDEAGKEILVNKTPNDVFIVDEILDCWPDARFIFLLRHPAAIAKSRQAARPQDSPERNATMVARYANALENARREHAGHTVRYEDLAADPAGETRKLCEFLGVEWEPEMLDYGKFDHGRFKSGLGDWSPNIKSGRVQAPAPPPTEDEIPEKLRDVARAWGYLDGDGAVPAAPESVESAG